MGPHNWEGCENIQQDIGIILQMALTVSTGGIPDALQTRSYRSQILTFIRNNRNSKLYPRDWTGLMAILGQRISGYFYPRIGEDLSWPLARRRSNACISRRRCVRAGHHVRIHIRKHRFAPWELKVGYSTTAVDRFKLSRLRQSWDWHVKPTIAWSARLQEGSMNLYKRPSVWVNLKHRHLSHRPILCFRGQVLWCLIVGGQFLVMFR
jgi:hypothetical protein